MQRGLMFDDSIQVRRATPADADEIARVHVESSEDAYAPLAKTWDAPSVYQRTQMWHEWLTAAQSVSSRVDLVAERDGGIVGFVSAGQPRRRDVNVEAEVYVIHVLPGVRNQGIGGRLWSRVCDEVRGEALRSMYLETFAELRCCSFYESRGGEIAQSEREHFKGGEVTKVVYRWAEGQSSEVVAYALRTAVELDFEFLYALKRSVYRDHVIATYGEWNDQWQRDRLASHFNPAAVQIVVVDGQAAGELVVQWDEDPVFLVAIELAPQCQGRGIGTAIINDVLDRARQQGKTVRLQVFKVNKRAIRLYERLGFQPYGATDTHKLMATR